MVALIRGAAGTRERDGERGFSLLEVVFAAGLLAISLLGMLGVMTLSVKRVVTSSASLTAREKAREAIESVHTARDTGALSWAKIQNVSAGGVFLDGPQSLTTAGPDGLVNTADDGDVESVAGPGPDGVFGSADDTRTPLTEFTREIAIGALSLNGSPDVNPNLREIIVTVRYRVQDMWRTYTLRTFVSSFS